MLLQQTIDGISLERIKMEAYAIFAIIARAILSSDYAILSSNVLTIEIIANPNKSKMTKSLTLYQAAKEYIGHNAQRSN